MQTARIQRPVGMDAQGSPLVAQAELRRPAQNLCRDILSLDGFVAERQLTPHTLQQRNVRTQIQLVVINAIAAAHPGRCAVPQRNLQVQFEETLAARLKVVGITIEISMHRTVADIIQQALRVICRFAIHLHHQPALLQRVGQGHPHILQSGPGCFCAACFHFQQAALD